MRKRAIFFLASLVCSPLIYATDMLTVCPKQGEATTFEMQERTKLAFENSGTELVIYAPEEEARYTLSTLKSVALVPLQVDPYRLIDGEPFTNDTRTTLSQGITYSRVFNRADVWYAFYVPINISMTAELLEDFTIAELFAYIPDRDTNGDGRVDGDDQPSLYISPLKEGDDVVANYPYFARPKTTFPDSYTFVSSDNVLYAAENGSVECATAKMRYVFTGIYESTPLNSSMWYVATDGLLKFTNSASARLGSYRWYMQKINKNGVYEIETDPSAVGERIMVIGEDLSATALEELRAGIYDAMIYTILGQPVGYDMSTLPNGIYVRHGQRIFINH